ncbi:zinc-binding alcohol dehydrogenase family protein [Listeria grandensis]|uniref:Zinc-type alcohol dehydrogenase-like protein n=1 Tax=Listeria grandensis TaxID=1494963 RepID=A0A7X1CPG5_9LIST|nr:zinc-binding alcohol dehydrogenase family protein [Listeria grandensis]MBC1474433.1 zinc-binding alcohol dehydrogenase family protein [Listeria grandensis]MBC1935978.1 zinc-binding alcohol dehydrogenase family protein [Listeria grandensis]
MKAVGLKEYLPINDTNSFIDIDIEKPARLGEREMLVEVKAISVNPVDTKVRSPKQRIEEDYRILGWDASGIVTKLGSNCTLFEVGDEVYYAGAFDRSGTNANYHVVDERIVGFKPRNLDFENAAALPLTVLTAWEALYDRLNIRAKKDDGKTILIINGAGGVGSIAIQLAKWIGLRVIATASRDESAEWVTSLGADYVINHHTSLSHELNEIDVNGVDFILCLHDTEMHWDDMCEVIKPEGKISSIVGTKGPVDLGLLMDKSVSFHWEFMFTRARYETVDMIRQHEILNRVAEMFEQNQLKPTLTEKLSPINAENLRKAHAAIESGKTIGKIVLSDF